MRVCLVGPAYPYRGGIAHFTTLLAKEFARRHQVKIINFKRLYPSLLFPGKTQFDESAEALSHPSLRAIDSINPFSYLSAGLKLARFRPNLVVFQWWHPFFAPAYAGVRLALAAFCRPKVVYLCHNVLPHESSLFDRLLIRLGFTGVGLFLLQSREDEGKLLLIKRRARTRVSPHPIYDFFVRGRWDREGARRELGLGERVILFFGYVRPYKGLGVLLRAMPRILAEVEVDLLVVGEFYEERRKYEGMMAELGIGDRVKIVDRYVANEEVERFFVAADLAVLPYLSATQSGVVQIAYAFEVPVVVTEVGGLPDVVVPGVTGMLVPPGDPGPLAQAVIDYFARGMGPVFRQGIRGARDEFSWSRCAQALLELAFEEETAG